MFETRKKTKKRLTESFGNLKYDSFNFDYIEKYFRNKDQTGTYQVLSDKTWRTIPPDTNKFVEQERFIEQIAKDPGLRLKLQVHLDKLNSESTYFITSLFQDEHIKKPKWFFIIPVLSLTSLLSILMIPFIPQFFILLLGVVLINMAIHYWNKRNLDEYMGSIPQLLKLNIVAKELLKYRLPVRINSELENSIKVIDKVRNHMSLFNMEAKLRSDIGTAFWSMLEILKALFLLEPLLLFGVLKQLDTKRREIGVVFSFIGYVDLLISIASLRHGLEVFCLPDIRDNSKVLDTIEMYHPLIVNCIQNSINADGKSILITGSNMSGKTSFIRTIGLNAVTALTINTCFARQFSLSRFKIYSAIRISDNLMNDRSYYFEEVLTIKEMIEKSQMPESNLFLLDEIFKGTNTIERISAGRAVLSFLSNQSNIVFVSTHDIELAELLQDTYELFHFSEQVDNKSVDFDFKLKEGKLKNRNAIRILEINEYPEKIISEAIELSHELDKIFIVSKI